MTFTRFWEPEQYGCQMGTRKIIHVDMDAFYASGEQLDNPQLRGKPVIVAWKGNRSVVCSASYETKSFGVHSAMPAVRAEHLCPTPIFIAPDFTRYRAVSRSVREIFTRHTARQRLRAENSGRCYACKPATGEATQRFPLSELQESAERYETTSAPQCVQVGLRASRATSYVPSVNETSGWAGYALADFVQPISFAKEGGQDCGLCCKQWQSSSPAMMQSEDQHPLRARSAFPMQ